MRGTHRFRGHAVLDEARELLLVRLLVILHQHTHILGHVDAQDVLAVDLGGELFALGVEAREALGAEEAANVEKNSSKSITFPNTLNNTCGVCLQVIQAIVKYVYKVGDPDVDRIIPRVTDALPYIANRSFHVRTQ